MKQKKQNKQTNKQTKKTSRTVFVIYVEWNSCEEIIISNEVEIGKHLGVTDARKMLSEGKPQKINHPTNFKVKMFKKKERITPLMRKYL